MDSEIITRARFDAILSHIPADSQGLGFERDGIYYSVKREERGTYKGKPYHKPAHIQVTANNTRYWIKLVDGALELSYDPTGGFKAQPVTDQPTLRDLEAFFVNLEGHLNIVRRKRKKDSKPVTPLDTQALDTLLAHLLAGYDSAQRDALREQVALAYSQPARYVEAHREHLLERGITAPIKVLLLIALVDALLDLNRAVELDWNADAETVLWAVGKLTSPLGLTLPVVDEALATHEVLNRLNDALAPQGYTLVNLEMDADAYVVTVIERRMFEECVRLGRELGIKVKGF